MDTVEQEIHSRGDEPVLPLTSLPRFSDKIWGIRNKALTVIGARTSQGKSAFALQIAWDLAFNSGKQVWFISLEMDRESLVERLFCHAMFVDNEMLLKGMMKHSAVLQTKWLEFRKTQTNLMITCGLGQHWQEIDELIELVGGNPDVVIIDYVQNIHTNPRDTRETINEYLRRFRDLAVKHQFAGIICSQINRGAEQTKDHEPTLAQLKESGFLEESADVVMLLHWRDFYNPQRKLAEDTGSSRYLINVAKNRNGRTARYEVLYTPRFYRFAETSAVPGISPVQQMFNAEVIGVQKEETQGQEDDGQAQDRPGIQPGNPVAIQEMPEMRGERPAEAPDSPYLPPEHTDGQVGL
jgi:replicative DNA helicase